MEIEHQFFTIAVLCAGVSGIVTSLLVPLAARLAVVLEALDQPEQRKVHLLPVPRLGGVAMVVGLVVGAIAVGLPMWSQWPRFVETRGIFALCLGGVLVFLTGLVDDLFGLSALKKLLVECVAAGILVSAGWKFDVLGIPGGSIELGAFGSVLAVIWIVGVTNAINLIDGLDGLAAGVVAIIGISFLSFVLFHNSPLAVAIAAALVGSCIGFLPHNWEPARIFMGDAGSLTLGFLLGGISVYTTLKSPAAVAILVPVLALGVPVFDTLLVMLVRFLERPKGRFTRRFLRIFHADRNHLHHLLESLVQSRRSIVRWIYAMVTVSCGMALLVALTKRNELGVVLLVVEVGAIVAVRSLGFARKARMITLRQREKLKDELQPFRQGPGTDVVHLRGHHLSDDSSRARQR